MGEAVVGGCSGIPLQISGGLCDGNVSNQSYRDSLFLESGGSRGGGMWGVPPT